MVGAEDALEHLARRRRRAAAGSTPAAPTGCARSGRSAGRAALAQHAGHQRQVVVLHQHRRALGGLLGQRRRRTPRCRPRRTPTRGGTGVEDGRGRGVVEQVVDEPERGVGDRVVGAVEGRRVDVEHPHRGPPVSWPAWSSRPPVRPGRRAVAVGQRRADPDDRRRCGGRTARRPGRRRRGAPRARRRRRGEGDRPAVGGDEQRRGAGGHDPHLPARCPPQATPPVPRPTVSGAST